MTPWIACRGFAVQPIVRRRVEHPSDVSDAARNSVPKQSDARGCADVSEAS